MRNTPISNLSSLHNWLIDVDASFPFYMKIIAALYAALIFTFIGMSLIGLFFAGGWVISNLSWFISLPLLVFACVFLFCFMAINTYEDETPYNKPENKDEISTVSHGDCFGSSI